MDLCIPKAFASVLHYVGFCAAAKEINDKFYNREYCYGIKDTNFKAISNFAVQVLPSWLQIRSKNINEFNWQLDLDQFDIFVAGLVGTDGIANHAIAIYNNWIFDGNEKIAIPLCKEGLDYCVSTVESSIKFVSFTGGFYFREEGKKNRLKRSCDSNDDFELQTNYSSKAKSSKGVHKPSKKRKKID